MRSIKVSFRGVFRYPTGIMNPAGYRFPVDIPIEVYGIGERWKVRHLKTGLEFKALPRYADPWNAQAGISRCFEEVVTTWQSWGLPPGEQFERMLEPGEFADLGGGKFGWYTAEDHTHIALEFANGREYRAACGALVSTKHFVSTKANIEPSCPKCAAVYRKDFATR